MSESMVRVCKMSLRKSGLDKKTFTLPQWNFILAKISFLSNARPLNVKYMDETFVPLSASHLLFGSRKNIFPRDIELNENDSSLFASLATLDKQIKAYENIYMTTYAVELSRWTKFKTKGRGLKERDVVFLLDKINKSTKQNQLGIITKKNSDRTFKVEYMKKEAIIDPTSYEIKRVGKKTEVLRPAQQLCFITTEDCRDEVNVDPFTPTTDVDESDLVVPYSPPEGGLNDEFYAEDVEVGSPLTAHEGLEPPADSNIYEHSDYPVVSAKTNDVGYTTPDSLHIVDVNDDDVDIAEPRQRLKVQFDNDVPEMVDTVRNIPVKNVSKRPRGRPAKNKTKRSY